MKSFFIFILAGFGFLLSGPTVYAQTAETAQETAVKNETFKVYGNCGMCKRRIEGALADVAGVATADWDVDTKMLTVQYDPAVIDLQQVHEKVAAVGHDTDKVRAPDEVYETLHGCCKYDRKEE